MRRILPILSVLLLSCSGNQYAEKVDKVVPQAPDAFSAVTFETVEKDGFCSDFGNGELDGLVNKALDRNLDLRSAWARLEQAEAIQAQADSTLWPTVSAQFEASRSKSPAAPPIGSVEGNQFRLSAPVSYELDVWGKLAARRQAAEYDTQAVRADVEAFAISVSAQVSEAWFDVVSQRQKMTLIEEQIETAEKFLELTKLRLANGVATALDVTQQEQEIYRLRGQYETAKALEEISRLRLAVLTGEPPRAEVVGATAELPEIPAFPALGVPADILENRPDVRSARLRLEAADERTVAAVRDRLPSIRLSASMFLSTDTIGDLFDELFWSIGGSATQPIFEGGRRNAVIDQSEAAARERLFSYAQSMLTAFQEVESAVVRERQQKLFMEELEQQLESAEASLVIARERYRSGALDYLRVLTALRSVQTLQQAMVDAQRQQLSFRIQTCRAVGGAWTKELEAPKKDDLDE